MRQLTYPLGKPSSYDLVQSNKGSRKDEEHIARINVIGGLTSICKLPVRRPLGSKTRLTSRSKPLSFILCTHDGVIPSLPNDSDYRSLHHPQQCLLYAFSANVPRLPIPTVSASGQFVRFIYVNDSGAEVASIEALYGVRECKYLALCVSQFAACS